MCLNNSVISGKCTGCAAYRERVDHLLAQLEDRGEKLANVGSYSSELWALGGPQGREVCKRLDRILNGGE